jgi:hypothetical protein
MLVPQNKTLANHIQNPQEAKTRIFQAMSISSTLKAFDHSMGSSVIPFSSYYTAPDHPPHHTSGLFAGPSMATGHSLPRSTLFRRFLPGSIDELPHSSFVATSQRVFGFSTTTSERASQANPEPTPFLTTVANLLPYTIWGMEGA